MIKPGTIFTGDNLPILRGMDSASVDLVYLDPPFNSNRNYAAPIGSKAAGAEFKDVWTLKDTDDAWWGELAEDHPALYRVIDGAGAAAAGGRGNKGYCIYMAVRLLEIRRVLKPTGSLYLHCDPTMSHSLKLLLDAVFGGANFRNEIVWCYSVGGRPKTDFARKHDVIFRYVKGENFTFNADAVRLERKNTHMKISTDAGGNQWQTKKDANTGKIYRYPVKDGTLCPDWWTDITQLNRSEKERTGYPTQKPLKLLQRIIKASSNQNDIVLDPFCGCATACLAAESLRRKWIGIDISAKAFELINERLKNELGGIFTRVIHRTDIPKRAGAGRSKDVKHTLFGKQQGICNGCRSAFEFRNFEIDHIVPQAKGGTDHDDNLQLLCGWCNRKKGRQPMEYLIAELDREGIRERGYTSR